jgi:hypothetical protein
MDRVRQQLGRRLIKSEREHSAVARLDPKQPVARLRIPAARDSLNRDSFREPIGNLRAAKPAPAPRCDRSSF